MLSRDDIIRMAREAGIRLPDSPFPARGSFTLPELLGLAALVAAAEREKLAHWMRSLGYATGHGDTIEDLLDHLGTQIAGGLEAETMAERQRCAMIARQFDRDHPNTNYGGFIARLIEGDMA